MDQNIIQVNGIDYRILFLYNDQGQTLMLVEDDQDVYCTRFEEVDGKPQLLPASDEQLEKTVAAYNKMLQEHVVYNGTMYERTADISGLSLACLPDAPGTLYPFIMDGGSWKPMHLDAAGILFYKNMYRARLEENHDFLMELKPGTGSAANLPEESMLARLKDSRAYLAYNSKAEPYLLFVDEAGRPVVSAARQQELFEQFQKWEQQQYEQASQFVLENLPQENDQ